MGNGEIVIMTTSSDDLQAMTRRLLHVIMQRLASVKNQTVGNAIGKDESTVSRIASGELGVKLADLQAFLSALGLKVVDKNQVCIDRDVFNSYRVLAKTALNNPEKLDWDNAE